MKPTCPKCLEVIKAGATRCPHCQADIDPDDYMAPVLAEQAEREAAAGLRKKRSRMLVRYVLPPLSLILLVFATPAYQAYKIVSAAYMPFTAVGMTKRETYDFLPTKHAAIIKNGFEKPPYHKFVPIFLDRCRTIFVDFNFSWLPSDQKYFEDQRILRRTLTAELRHLQEKHGKSQVSSMLYEYDKYRDTHTRTWRKATD